MEYGTRIPGFGRNWEPFEKLGSGKTKKIEQKDVRNRYLDKFYVRNRDAFLGAGAGAGGRGPGPGAGAGATDFGGQDPLTRP